METYIDFTKDLEAEATTIRQGTVTEHVMHMHSSYELVYIPSGLHTTTVTADGTYEVREPVIVLIAPFCMHFTYFNQITDVSRTRRAVLYIGDDFRNSMPVGTVAADELMNGARVRIFNLSGAEERIRRTLNLIVNMETEARVRDRKPCMIARLATGILLEQLRELSNSGSELPLTRKDDGYISQVPLWILRHLSENPHTADIAQAFYVSRDKLNKDFSSYMQTSVRKFIIALRINKARQMLMDGTATVQEITAACGFENEIYFYTFFKKNAGMTPKEYASQYESGMIPRVKPK